MIIIFIMCSHVIQGNKGNFCCLFKADVFKDLDLGSWVILHCYFGSNEWSLHTCHPAAC